MNSAKVVPAWIFTRIGVFNLIPFPQPGERPPHTPKLSLIGRIVRDVNLSEPLILSNRRRTSAWICDTRGYALDDIQQKARNQVRKGIREGAIVSRLSWSAAWPDIETAIQQTMKRQGRSSVKSFLNQLRALRRCDELNWSQAVDIWIVQRQGTIGAFVIGLKYGETYFILHEFSITSELPWCPNNVLVFEVTQRALAESGCTQVNYGVDGLDSGGFDGLSRFKTRMGYRLVECEEEFLAHPFTLHVIRVAGRLSTILMRRFPQLARLSTLRILVGLNNRIN